VPTLLSINNYHYRRGGADIMFLEQNRLFEEQGWDVVPFAMQHEQNEPTPWSEHFPDELEFGNSYSPLGTAVRAGRVVYSLQARRRLRRVIDLARPDVAHVHNVYHHLSPSVLGQLGSSGIPTVVTLHDLKLACPAYQMLTHDGICERCKGGRLYNVALHRCIKGSRLLSTVVLAESSVSRLTGAFTRNVDRFITPSRFYRDKLVEWGFDRERFSYIPNHIDPDLFDPRYEPGRAFIYFGRLAREKGLDTLVRAAAAADVPLWLVGTGPEAGPLAELARSLGAQVELFGYLSGGPLHERVRAARASVLPSEWYENAPVAVMESYALGKPFIGARIGGIGELVREGETGYGFTSGSVDELADALRRMADLPDEQVAAMGREGRRWMEADFTSARYVERVLALYAELGVAVPEVAG
jgi:glycosyltransferase involved in cell wall biosynthesis